jgi:ribose transport system permease protein
VSEQIEKKPFNALGYVKYLYTNHTYIFSFILLLVIMLFINHDYLSFTSLSTLLMQSTIKGILALGMTFVIISGMIDLSIGSNIAITAGLGIVILNKSESIVLMFVFCVAFSVFLTAIIGLFVTKGKIAPFVVTLATMSIFRSIIVQLGQGGPFNVASAILPRFRVIAAGNIMKAPNMAIVFIVLTAIMTVISTQTKFGRYIYAIGSNETASRLSGINVNRVKVEIFMLMGAMIGVTSFLFASRMTSVTAANAGMSYEMDAIAAAIIGGTSFSGGRGRILGTFFGALSLQLIENLLVAARIPPFLTGLVKGTIILVAILLQSKKESKKA